jgi:hypothetical protein
MSEARPIDPIDPPDNSVSDSTTVALDPLEGDDDTLPIDPPESSGSSC